MFSENPCSGESWNRIFHHQRNFTGNDPEKTGLLLPATLWGGGTNKHRFGIGNQALERDCAHGEILYATAERVPFPPPLRFPPSPTLQPVRAYARGRGGEGVKNARKTAAAERGEEELAGMWKGGTMVAQALPRRPEEGRKSLSDTEWSSTSLLLLLR